MNKKIAATCLLIPFLAACTVMRPAADTSLSYSSTDTAHFTSKQCGADLDQTYNAIIDGMLNYDTQNTLSPQEKQLLTSFVQDCAFFKQPDHDKAWLQNEYETFDHLTKTGNLKAAPIRKFIDHLYYIAEETK